MKKSDFEEELDLSGIGQVHFKQPTYNLKKLTEYARKNGIAVEELTEEEKKQFITGYM